MEVGPITPAQAAEKALAAWAAAVEAINADKPVSEPALPGADSDQGHEVATLQTLWRAPSPNVETSRVHDAVPDVPAAQADFALPDALLVPAALTGLHTEPGMAWPLPIPPAPWQPLAPQAERRRQPREQPDRRREPPPADEATEATEPHGSREPASNPLELVFDADDDGAWCEPLTRGLSAQLAQRLVPQALLAASEQWQRGRCVVLACPQGDDPASPAWAHVLWPRPGTQTNGTLALHGLRVEARLTWRTLPPAMPWCHVRAIREHHPRRGRQLVATESVAAAQATILPCEVQLGPVLDRPLRRCEVRLHVQAAQRFWAALGQQWSVHVVVCARPLLAARTACTEATPC